MRETISELKRKAEELKQRYEQEKKQVTIENAQRVNDLYLQLRQTENQIANYDTLKKMKDLYNYAWTASQDEGTCCQTQGATSQKEIASS